MCVCEGCFLGCGNGFDVVLLSLLEKIEKKGAEIDVEHVKKSKTKGFLGVGINYAINKFYQDKCRFYVSNCLNLKFDHL